MSGALWPFALSLATLVILSGVRAAGPAGDLLASDGASRTRRAGLGDPLGVQGALELGHQDHELPDEAADAIIDASKSSYIHHGCRAA
jgi:hypothetical protein